MLARVGVRSGPVPRGDADGPSCRTRRGGPRRLGPGRHFELGHVLLRHGDGYDSFDTLFERLADEEPHIQGDRRA